MKMNKRDMKRKVRKEITSFLVHALNDDYPWDRVVLSGSPGEIVPNLIGNIRLWVFKDPDNPTEAEFRRLQNILFEMHQEAHQYEV